VWFVSCCWIGHRHHGYGCTREEERKGSYESIQGSGSSVRSACGGLRVRVSYHRASSNSPHLFVRSMKTGLFKWSKDPLLASGLYEQAGITQCNVCPSVCVVSRCVTPCRHSQPSPSKLQRTQRCASSACSKQLRRKPWYVLSADMYLPRACFLIWPIHLSVAPDR